jgi:Arc/MetJ-type ribon-helix-helix transcriptional regulator
VAQRNLRLSDEVVRRIGEAVKKEHYPSASAFIRAAIEAKLGYPKDAVDEANSESPPAWKPLAVGCSVSKQRCRPSSP